MKVKVEPAARGVVVFLTRFGEENWFLAAWGETREDADTRIQALLKYNGHGLEEGNANGDASHIPEGDAGKAGPPARPRYRASQNTRRRLAGPGP